MKPFTFPPVSAWIMNQHFRQKKEIDFSFWHLPYIVKDWDMVLFCMNPNSSSQVSYFLHTFLHPECSAGASQTMSDYKTDYKLINLMKTQFFSLFFCQKSATVSAGVFQIASLKKFVVLSFFL